MTEGNVFRDDMRKGNRWNSPIAFPSGGNDGELGDFGLMLILGESRLLTMFEGRLELFLLMIVCERR